MAKLASAERDQIFWIAKIFYREKRHHMPREFGPRHKMWVHFLRARLWMLALKALARGKYKTFIKAQFEYAPGKDPERVFPQMLYNHRATQKWQWYLDKKERRLGTVLDADLSYEKDLSTNRLKAFFEQGAWELEGLVRSGFTEEEALRAFEGLFDPSFILASPGAIGRLEKNEKHYGPRVRAAFNRFRAKLPKAIQRMRRLYGECRTGQEGQWDRRLAVRRLQLEDVHAGSADPSEDPGAVGAGS